MGWRGKREGRPLVNVYACDVSVCVCVCVCVCMCRQLYIDPAEQVNIAVRLRREEMCVCVSECEDGG